MITALSWKYALASSFTAAGTGSEEYRPGMVQNDGVVQNNGMSQYQSVLLQGYVYDVQGDGILGMSTTLGVKGMDTIEDGIYKYHGRDYLVENGCIAYNKWYDPGDGNAAYFSGYGSRNGSGYDFGKV